VAIAPINREWGEDSFSDCSIVSLASQEALKNAGYTDGF
jgi:hypothetical protein